MQYVKTTLAPELEINLDDFTMNLSSSILYEDENGETGWADTVYSKYITLSYNHN